MEWSRNRQPIRTSAALFSQAERACGWAATRHSWSSVVFPFRPPDPAPFDGGFPGSHRRKGRSSGQVSWLWTDGWNSDRSGCLRIRSESHSCCRLAASRASVPEMVSRSDYPVCEANRRVPHWKGFSVMPGDSSKHRAGGVRQDCRRQPGDSKIHTGVELIHPRRRRNSRGRLPTVYFSQREYARGLEFSGLKRHQTTSEPSFPLIKMHSFFVLCGLQLSSILYYRGHDQSHRAMRCSCSGSGC